MDLIGSVFAVLTSVRMLYFDDGGFNIETHGEPERALELDRLVDRTLETHATV